ncbi:MAG: helix-turn-helix domain containing protein [Parachlamydiaceae bacterium]|nr:helix-turn-helix domain containing protein [Parachlamydiaceae bacterium]
MSSKEIDRAHFFNKVMNGNFNLLQVSKLLGLSYPQTKRLWSKYKSEGRRGLITKKRGRSNRTISHEKREEIAKIIAREYLSCGPLFVKEKLEERHGINYSSEFIRQVMIEYNLWVPKKKKIQPETTTT